MTFGLPLSIDLVEAPDSIAEIKFDLLIHGSVDEATKTAVIYISYRIFGIGSWSQNPTGVGGLRNVHIQKSENGW